MNNKDFVSSTASPFSSVSNSQSNAYQPPRQQQQQPTIWNPEQNNASTAANRQASYKYNYKAQTTRQNLPATNHQQLQPSDQSFPTVSETTFSNDFNPTGNNSSNTNILNTANNSSNTNIVITNDSSSSYNRRSSLPRANNEHTPAKTNLHPDGSVTARAGQPGTSSRTFQSQYRYQSHSVGPAGYSQTQTQTPRSPSDDREIQAKDLFRPNKLYTFKRRKKEQAVNVSTVKNPRLTDVRYQTANSISRPSMYVTPKREPSAAAPQSGRLKSLPDVSRSQMTLATSSRRTSLQDPENVQKQESHIRTVETGVRPDGAHFTHERKEDFRRIEISEPSGDATADLSTPKLRERRESNPVNYVSDRGANLSANTSLSPSNPGTLYWDSTPNTTENSPREGEFPFETSEQVAARQARDQEQQRQDRLLREQAAEARRAEAEKQARDARRRREQEAARRAEEERKARDARLRREQEAARRAEEERQARDARLRREQEAARRTEEERKARDARLRREQEAARRAEEEKQARDAGAENVKAAENTNANRQDGEPAAQLRASLDTRNTRSVQTPQQEELTELTISDKGSTRGGDLRRVRTRTIDPRPSEELREERERELRLREFEKRAPALFFKPYRDTLATERARRFVSRDAEPIEREPRGTVIRRRASEGTIPDYPGRREPEPEPIETPRRPPEAAAPATPRPAERETKAQTSGEIGRGDEGSETSTRREEARRERGRARG